MASQFTNQFVVKNPFSKTKEVLTFISVANADRLARLVFVKKFNTNTL